MKELCENLQEELHILKPTSKQRTRGKYQMKQTRNKNTQTENPKTYGCAILLNITKNIGVHGFSNVQQEITIARDIVIDWYYENLPKSNDHYEKKMAQLMHKAIDDNLRKVFDTNF